MTSELIEEILISIGLEKINQDVDEEIWDLKEKDKEGVIRK